jgi:hypothetical protein
MQLKLFFLPSKAVASRITETFDFVWPTASAIWNLRWQVQGLVNALPNVKEQELLGRFVGGSGIRGANLKRACIETSWETQQEQFAKFLLFEFCALYETWCELITEQLALPSSSKKHLQFPPSVSTSGAASGMAAVQQLIQQHPSSVLDAAMHAALSTNRKYSAGHLDELLICYRYFKELRNCLIHGSSSALQKLRSAEQAYEALNASTLGLSQRPEYVALSDASPPRPSLRGVVGFGEVVLKLVCTIDIELARTTYAEPDFIRRWRVLHGNQPVSVSGQQINRRNWRIGVLVRSLGLPSPVSSSAFASWLRSNNLVFY